MIKAAVGLTKGQAEGKKERKKPEKQRCLGGSALLQFLSISSLRVSAPVGWRWAAPPPSLWAGSIHALLGLARPSICRFPCGAEWEHIFLSEFPAGDSQHGYLYPAALSPGAIPGDELPPLPPPRLVLGAV